jgi:hypothetical protein
MLEWAMMDPSMKTNANILEQVSKGGETRTDQRLVLCSVSYEIRAKNTGNTTDPNLPWKKRLRNMQLERHVVKNNDIILGRESNGVVECELSDQSAAIGEAFIDIYP